MDKIVKYWPFVLILVATLSGCMGKTAVDSNNVTYRLQLVDLASKKPIVETLVILIPRVILLKAAPGTLDPNLKYALKLTTDNNGILSLNEKGELKKLFSYFKDRSGIVDCTVEGFSGFTIEYNPISKKYLLTAFDKNNRVRPLGGQFLIEGKVVELFLDRLS